MSSHEIVIATSNIERAFIAEPGDTAFWDSMETEAGNQHALVFGSLDDALVLTGTLDELDRAADLIKRKVTFRRFEWTFGQMRQANAEAERLMDEANDSGEPNEEMAVRDDANQYAQTAAELAAELLGVSKG